jgi:serine/threonine-protein kinase HipA
MANDIAAVYFRDYLAGYLSKTEEGYRFEYTPAWLNEGIAIAYTLPLQAAPFNEKRLPPFFDNLVSEGWLKRQQSKMQHIDEKDHFGLLLQTGGDLPGAVTIKPCEVMK